MSDVYDAVLKVLVALALTSCAVSSAAGPGSASPDLSERETTPDRLLVVHYPNSFLKFTYFAYGHTIHLAGPKEASKLSDMVFRVDSRPTSEDVNELTKSDMFCSDGPGWTAGAERVQRQASCSGGVPGLERSCLSTSKADPNKQLFSWTCTFVKNHHHFTFVYSIPNDIRTEAEPLVRKILAAVEAN